MLDNCTAYQVAKDLEINARTVNRYQNDESPIDNMAFGTARKLYNYYLKGMGKMGERYTVSAHKEYETQFGMIEEEQVYVKSFIHASRAEEKAKELYNKGGHSSIYIEFGHHSASAYWNPAEGMNSAGKDWVRHFENMVEIKEENLNE